MFQVSAKPLEWPELKEYPNGDAQCDERHMGFVIIRRSDEPEDQRFEAAWGEGDPEFFPTLDEAKQWCQAEADRWVREFAKVEAVAV